MACSASVLSRNAKKTISTRLPRVHIPHDSSIRHGAKSTERLGKDFIVHFGAQVTDEDMVVTGGILLILLTLVGPIDTDLRVEDLATIQSLQGGLRGTHVHVLDEAVIEPSMLVVPVGDYFNMLNRAGDSEDLCEHVLCHTRAQISDVEMSTPLKPGGR